MTAAATAIVLAAGEGTRMRSALPKVAHELLGVPMLRFVVDAAAAAGVPRVVVVTGHGAEIVETLVSGVEFARQDVQHGTGHAVMCALEAVGDIVGPVVVLAGDTPLIRSDTIGSLVAAQQRAGAACVVLSAEYDDPTGYGRLIRDESGAVHSIVEQKDLPLEFADVRECNTGTYCFDGAALASHLHRLENDNAQNEYYLTDLVGLFVQEGLGVQVVRATDPLETLGINSRIQLAEATRVVQRRINTEHMLAGVTMTDPDLVWIAPSARIGRDVVLKPVTILAGETAIGDGCVIGPNSRITGSTVGARCVIDASVLEACVLGDDVAVGPWVFVRPGTKLCDGARIGAGGEEEE